MPGTEDLYPLAQLFPFASKSYDSDSCPVMGFLKGKKDRISQRFQWGLGCLLSFWDPCFSHSDKGIHWGHEEDGDIHGALRKKRVMLMRGRGELVSNPLKASLLIPISLFCELLNSITNPPYWIAYLFLPPFQIIEKLKFLVDLWLTPWKCLCIGYLSVSGVL